MAGSRKSPPPKKKKTVSVMRDLSPFILLLRRQKETKPGRGAEFEPSFCGLGTLLKLHA